MSNFLLTAATFAVQPIIPLYVRNAGGGPTDTSLFFASLTFTSLLVQLPAGLALSRLGTRRILIGSRSIATVVIGAFFVLRLPVWSLILLRSVQGLAYGAYTPALRTTIAAAGDPEHRGRRFMQLEATSMAATLIGPLLGGATATLFGPRAVFGLATLLSIAVVAELTKVPGTSRATEGSNSPRTRPRLGLDRGTYAPLVALVVVGCNDGMDAVVFPQYITDRGFGPLVIGILYTLFSLPWLVLAKPIGELVDSADRRFIIASALGIVMTCNLLFPLSRDLWQISILVLIHGTAYAYAFPAVYAQLGDSSLPEDHGRAMAAGSFSYGLGDVTGTMTLGSLSAFNIALPFFGAAALEAGTLAIGGGVALGKRSQKT